MNQSSITDPFKHIKARKVIILWGGVILFCITMLSSISSFQIFKGGFADLGVLQPILALFAVLVVEGAFVWLVYGYTRAFSSSTERSIAMVGMCMLLVVMMINLVTHFMLVKSVPLNSFQDAWISWGAITVFIAVLLIVLCITLTDPVIRLIRLELRYLGLQQEKILEAKTDSLDSELIQVAMTKRAEWEAQQLAARIVGQAKSLPQPRREDWPEEIEGGKDRRR